MISNLCLLISYRSKVQRKIWKMPGRTSSWWINLVGGIMPEEEYIRNLRMDINLFGKLCDELREIISPRTESFRNDTIPADKRPRALEDDSNYFWCLCVDCFDIITATL